jgi:small multidrug resistance family-3 protein
MSWILGAIGGFILFLYGIVSTFQPSYFHRIYAAYGGVFIAMALLWGLLFTFQGREKNHYGRNHNHK